MARVRALLGTVALLALTPLPAAAQPSSPEELAAAVARPGVVHISVTWHGWVRDKRTGEVFGGTAGYEVKTSCSGVVVSPDGYVATASHCVHTGPLGGGGALFEAAIADLGKTGRVRDAAKARKDFAEHGLAEGQNPDSPVDRLIQVERTEAGDTEPARDIAPATVVDLVAPEDGDVAVLKVPREHLPALEIRTEQTPVGTPILAIGYPGSTSTTVDPSLEPSNKNGQISARRTQGGRPFYEFSAAATHGMSGGPVVDMQGGVVGLVSQGSPGETQSFNFAASAQTLTEILKGKQIQVGVGQHDKDYRTGLDRYFEGDFNGAVEYFDAALAGSPGHQQATEYRKLAVGKGGVAGSTPTTLLVIFAIVCGCLAVATATAGTAVLVTRRKRLAALAGGSPAPTGFPATATPPGGYPATPPGGYAPTATPPGGYAAGGYPTATPPGGYTATPATPAGGYPAAPANSGGGYAAAPANPAGGYGTATPSGGYPVSPWAGPSATPQVNPVPQTAPTATPQAGFPVPAPIPPTVQQPIGPQGLAQQGLAQQGGPVAPVPSDPHPTATRHTPIPATEDGPTVSTSAPDLSALPAVLGVDPQPDRQRDTDQTERRETPAHQAEDQTEPRRGHVQPGTPLAGHPGPDQADDGDRADQGDEDRRP